MIYHASTIERMAGHSGLRAGFRGKAAALSVIGTLLCGTPATVVAQSPAPAAPVAQPAAPAVVNANPEGIYHGSMTFKQGSASYPVYAIVAKDGSTAFFVRTSSAIPSNPHGFSLGGIVMKPRGSVFSSPFTVYSQPGYKVGNLPLFTGASGTINGLFKPGGVIIGRFMTPHDVGTFTLQAMADDYARPATGDAIAGTFDHEVRAKGARAQAQETLNADGTGSGSEDGTRCARSQRFTIPDPAHNVYAVADTLSCRSASPKKYSGYQAFFPRGTGAAWNEGTNFEADTLVTITHGEQGGAMRIATKRSQDGSAAVRPAASVAGLYHGEMTVAGTSTKYPVFAIVLKDGKASVFARTAWAAPDSPLGFAFRGVVFKPNGAEFETPFTPFTGTGNVVAGLEKFPGTAGVIRGTIKPGETITATFAHPAANGTLTLKAMPEEHGRMGSGEDIKGIYDHVFTVRGEQIIGYEVIKPDGTNVHYDDVLKCPVYQIYTIPDAYHNAYVVNNKVACPNRPMAEYHGLQAFFPAGTGAEVNDGEPFTTDTILAITEDNRTGFLKIAK